MSKFSKWMANSTTHEKIRLAGEAGTSAGHLYQLASEDRFASASLAAQLEAAFEKFHPELGITRADFSGACARCKYFKQCKGKTK